MAATSYLCHLECTNCHETFSADQVMCTCPTCDEVLFVRNDLDGAAKTRTKAALLRRPWNLWRYAEIMTVRDPANALTLGEGGMPRYQQ